MDPNVKAGDFLDIRPYVKTKLIPGGRRDECRYVDGIVFRKNVTHKTMPRYAWQAGERRAGRRGRGGGSGGGRRYVDGVVCR